MLRSLLRDALIPRQQPRLVINPQLLKRRLTASSPWRIMTKFDHESEIKVYNSSNKVPKIP